MALTDKLTAIAEAIRAKTGDTAKLTLDAMPGAIGGIATEPVILPASIVDYIHTETASVASRVRSVMQEDSIVFIALSDSHYAGDMATTADWQQGDEGNIHACMAVKALTYLLPVDFITHLGDAGKGTAQENNDTHKKQIQDYMAYMEDAAGDIPLFAAIGNHDTGIYYHNAQTDGGVHTLPGAWLYENFTALSASENTVISGESCGGYCYRDFPDKKLRVILMNTSENLITAQTDNGTSETQRLWVAQTLQNLNTKSDAADWGCVVLAHYALDYGDACRASNVFKAYVNGESITLNGTTVNFSGGNGAKFYGQFHGHFHNFVHDDLHGFEIFGTMVPYEARRLCVPNTSYNLENSYANPFYGISYHEDETYYKTPNTAEDTSFVVNVINPGQELIHSIHYGAGYDRTVSLKAKVYYSISTNLTDATIDNAAVSVEEGAAYTATITAKDGYELESVTVTMGGADVTASVYANGVITIPAVTGKVVITAKAVKPVNYTNLVPTAQVFTNGDTSPLDGVGYRDGGYLSSGGGITGGVSTHTCTGLIPLTRRADGKFPTIYIKGCEWTAVSYCRVYYYSSVKGMLDPSNFGGTATGTTIANWLDITTLGTKYYQFEPNDTMDAAPQDIAYFAISIKGSGKDLIITYDEPIE